MTPRKQRSIMWNVEHNDKRSTRYVLQLYHNGVAVDSGIFIIWEDEFDHQNQFLVEGLAPLEL
jgi:hypothetical protein